MKTKTRTVTLGAAVIAIVASFLAGAYVAGGYRTPPVGAFGVSDAVAAPEAIPGAKAALSPNIVELLESQLKAVKDDASLSPDQKKAKASDIHQNYKSQINSVLTPDQQKKWAAMKEGAKENH